MALCIVLLSLHATAQSGPDPIVVDGHLQRHSISPNAPQQILSIHNLLVGQTYSLIASVDPVLGACTPDIQSLDPAVQVLDYNSDYRQMRFVANAKVMNFQLNYYCSWDDNNPPAHIISIYCENCNKKKLKEYLQEMAVIEVQGGVPAEELIKEVFIGGNCFDVTNVTFAGVAGQIGTFAQGQTNIGFANGMIMATGDVSVAVGPNDQDNASAGYGSGTPDADLANLTNGAIFDRAGIEFDFTPTQTPLTFDFVFASEEYCEYVNTQFNDVFGFFISGPGFVGTQNIALIPGTPTPVAINNVNHLTNAGLYVNNTPAGGTLCGQNAATGPAVNEIQFDGYTRRFTAVANVQVCQTYHIKLKIGDVGDGIFDSAVFLRSGSFDAGGNASVDFVVNGDPDATEVTEGCGTVQLVFDRVGGNMSNALSVPYTISGTATNILDYSGIPPVAVIPAGQGSLTLNIPIINDNLVEGDETVILTLVNACSCLEPQEILTIKDYVAMTALPDTVTICGPGAAELGVSIENGVEPYSYQWSTGSPEPSISPYVAVSTNYRVTVTDFCGKTIVATARVIVNPPPNGQLLGPAPQICPGESATLMINFNGTGPFTIEYNYNGDPQTPITDITSDPYAFVVSEPGLYQLTAVFDGAGCQGLGTGTQLVLESTLNVTGVVTNVRCFGQSNGSINSTIQGGTGPYSYVWSGPTTIPNNIQDPTNLSAGNYTLTVTDNSGCQRIQTFVVNEPTALTPVVTNVQGPNCTNPNGGSITLNVTGGTPNYTFVWNNSQTVQNPQNLGIGTYTVTVTDQQMCTRTTNATVSGDFTPPTATGVATGQITCDVPAIALDGTGSSSGSGFSYNWTGNPGTITGGGNTLNPTVSAAGNYVLVVTNQNNGCTASATVPVTANNTLPVANAGPNQTLTCIVTSIGLDGSGSSTGSDFTYDWTASAGGIISGGGTTLNPVAGAAGTYTLVVTNNANGCTRSDDVVVNQNIASPNAVIGTPALLTCTNTTVPLNGSNSTPAGSLSYLWSTSNGMIATGQTSATAVASEPGTYTLQVTNTQNGCTDTEVVTVSQDNSVPTANASSGGDLDCITTQITINGGGSSTGPNYSLNWSFTPGGNIVSGQNTLNPVVNAPGTYTLLITNLINNCTASASVLIDQDNAAPGANAGGPATLTCANSSLTIGDSGTPANPNFTYVWNGPGILSGGNTPTPLVGQPGAYNLLVTNLQNGCTSTASLNVAQNTTNPTANVAPGGQLNCTTPVLQLNGSGSSTGAGFTYDWGSSTGGGIGAGANTLNPTVTAAGTYTLTVTNTANGCTASATTTVSSNADLPTVLATPDGILTCADQQVNIDAAGSSSGPTFTYQWGTLNGQIIGGQGTTQILVDAPGQYTLLVTNTSNNCTASFSVDVTADQTNPTADAGPGQILDCTQLSLSLDGSGSSSGPIYTYQWTAVSGGNFITPQDMLNPQVNEPGTYQLLVTNTQNGCSAVDQVLIQADANDPVVSIATPAILNCVTPQTVLDANGTSTGANINYIWTGPGIVGAGTNMNATANLPGNYNLLVTNTQNGCTSEAMVVVDQDLTPPPADAGPDDILNCYNPQLQIGGSGNPSGPNYTFAWTGAGIIGNPDVAQPIVDNPGQYNLVVTDLNNGCTSSDAVLINADFTAPTADAGPGFQLTCVQNSYTLNAIASTGPNFTYDWSTTDGSFTTPTDILNPTVNSDGFYFLVVTNTDNGCTATGSVQITQAADVPEAAAATPGILTCAVETLSLSGNGSSAGNEFSYQWTATAGGIIDSGATSLSPVISAPGTYTLAVTNNTNNCITYASVSVIEDVTAPAVLPEPGPTLTCAQPVQSVLVDVNAVGTVSYQWSEPTPGSIVGGGDTNNPSVNTGGIYNLTVTNQTNGCTSTAAVTVLVNQTPPLVVIAEPDLLTCVADQVVLNTVGSSTGLTMSYSWTVTGNANIVDQSDPTSPIVDQPGNYQLIITDTGNGCTQLNVATVQQDIQAPNADAGANALLTCAVSSVVLDGSNSSQNGNFFYQWTTVNGQILVGANSLTPTVVSGGDYTLVVVDNDNGCSMTDMVSVATDVTPPVAAIANPGLITCTQPQIILNGAGSSGGNTTYSWSTSDGNIVGGANANQATVNASGTYILSVLNNTNGCTSSASATVTDNIVLPIADAGAAFTLTCNLTQGPLLGTASTGNNFTYAWSTQNGQILSGANTLSPLVNQAGDYTLLVTNTNTGCSQTDLVTVFLETNIPVDLNWNLEPPGCKDNDGVISFTGITGGYGPYLYSIDGGDSYFNEQAFQNVSPGTYDLQIQDINGCEYSEVLNVPQAPDPTVTITPQFSISLGDFQQLNAQLPAGYPLGLIDTVIWTPLTGLSFNGSGVFSLLNPVAMPFVPTEYVVTVISQDGCEASDRVQILVDNEPHIYIPNVFKPADGDQQNGLVMIFADGDQVKGIRKFQIFDRWGEMVFQAINFQPNDPAHGWNGTIAGKELSPAVFAYFAEIELIDGRIILFKGDVTLVR